MVGEEDCVITLGHFLCRFHICKIVHSLKYICICKINSQSASVVICRHAQSVGKFELLNTHVCCQLKLNKAVRCLLVSDMANECPFHSFFSVMFLHLCAFFCRFHCSK